MSDDYLSFKLLSKDKYIPLVVLGTISSLLSIIGSSLVVCMSFREARKIMHRLMFALSISDLFSSVACLVMPFLVNSNIVHLPGAAGNAATCTLAGFFLSVGNLVGCTYNAYLSLYYLLVVKRSWKEQDFDRRFEFAGQIIAWGIPLTFNIVGAATRSINPSPLMESVCSFHTSPWTCNENEALDCDRSNESTVKAVVWTMTIFLLFFTFLGFVCTFRVWWTVRQTIKRSNAHRFDGDISSSRSDDRLKQVRTQAILYSLAYLNTFFWPSLGAILAHEIVHTSNQLQEIKNETPIYIVKLCFWTFYPLQGFLNFFIYIRLKAKKWKQANPYGSWFWVLKQVVGGSDISQFTMINPSTFNGSNLPTAGVSANSHATGQGGGHHTFCLHEHGDDDDQPN